MSQNTKENKKLVENDEIRGQAAVAVKSAAPRNAGTRQTNKYCVHGFVPDYCAHCKYGMSLDWR